MIRRDFTFGEFITWYSTWLTPVRRQSSVLINLYIFCRVSDWILSGETSFLFSSADAGWHDKTRPPFSEIRSSSSLYLISINLFLAINEDNRSTRHWEFGFSFLPSNRCWKRFATLDNFLWIKIKIQTDLEIIYRTFRWMCVYSRVGVFHCWKAS